jgi:8-oxo-dGTP pyrophosphatase MutT (NUDIX family)
MTLKKQLVVDALIPDYLGRIFVQKRTMTRRMFPECWDLVGGHVEENEDALSALEREIYEETGWTLREVTHELTTKLWHDGPNEY